MLRRSLAIMLSLTLCGLALASRPARAQESARSAEKARAAVRKLGVNPERRVEVRLLDGTKFKGSISAAGEDSFTVTDAKTGATRTLAYTEVARVKKPGGGLSPPGWVILGAAAVTAVIVGVTVVRPVLCDGGAGC